MAIDFAGEMLRVLVIHSFQAPTVLGQDGAPSRTWNLMFDQLIDLAGGGGKEAILKSQDLCAAAV